MKHFAVHELILGDDGFGAERIAPGTELSKDQLGKFKKEELDGLILKGAIRRETEGEKEAKAERLAEAEKEQKAAAEKAAAEKKAADAAAAAAEKAAAEKKAAAKK